MLKKYLIVFFVSMVPLVELRGAIPISQGFQFVALMLFVGIPIPGTGAWTGTLAASFLDMGFKKSVIAVLLGVLMAGIIMGLVSAGVFTAIFSFL